MLLSPLAQNARRKANAKVKWISAPANGWNARDDLTEMDKHDAIVLDNVVVVETGVKLRDGYESHVTGLGSAVLSLMEYSAPDGTIEIFGATATDIYDVTTAGSVGAAAVGSLTNGIWSHVMFATAGGNFLVCCNGNDAVQNYDGASWTQPAITGATSSNFVQVTSHMSRLWFVDEGTMKVWYLGASAVAGAATSIDFGPLSRKGGELTAMASWSRDGGSGIDDLAVFITSEGELHVYSGSDPSSANTWERVGTFQIAPPLGRRCFIKAGADLGILTTQGLVPLSNVLSLASTEVERVAATEKIGGAFKTAATNAGTSRGWQVIEYPRQALAIVNIPHTEGVTYYQYVLSTAKKAWSRWTGLPAECWSLFGERLMFGGTDGTVYEYTGETDNTAEINATIVQAFSDFGTVRNKVVKRMKPQIVGPVGYRPVVGLRFDYDETDVVFSATPFTAIGPEWDVAEWDVEDWGPELQPQAEWQAVRGRGFVLAIVVQISIDSSLTYNGSRLMYEEGGAV